MVFSMPTTGIHPVRLCVRACVCVCVDDMLLYKLVCPCGMVLPSSLGFRLADIADKFSAGGFSPLRFRSVWRRVRRKLLRRLCHHGCALSGCFFSLCSALVLGCIADGTLLVITITTGTIGTEEDMSTAHVNAYRKVRCLQLEAGSIPPSHPFPLTTRATLTMPPPPLTIAFYSRMVLPGCQMTTCWTWPTSAPRAPATPVLCAFSSRTTWLPPVAVPPALPWPALRPTGSGSSTSHGYDHLGALNELCGKRLLVAVVDNYR